MFSDGALVKCGNYLSMVKMVEVSVMKMADLYYIRPPSSKNGNRFKYFYALFKFCAHV